MISLRQFFLYFISLFHLAQLSAVRPFVIIIPSYNNEQWCEKNLLSALNQNYPQNRYRIIYINDSSTDQTRALVENVIKKHPKGSLVTLINNTARQGALKNFYDIITQQCKPYEIVLTLDGDDWLKDGSVLAYLNYIYRKYKPWVTYGSYEYHPATTGFKAGTHPYPPHVIKRNNFRTYGFIASHVRTFYAWLFHKIKKEDLQCDTGQFFAMCPDLAIMFPLLEMAGNRHHCVSKALYVYNIANPINENKVDHLQIERTTKTIVNRPHYHRLKGSLRYYLREK